MAGYIIARIDVTNPEGMTAYQEAVAPAVEAAGGKYLVRGGDVYGPDPDGRRLVELRKGHATLDAFVVEGV
jgi:uncharacterized protein (DUF1330 family)